MAVSARFCLSLLLILLLVAAPSGWAANSSSSSSPKSADSSSKLKDPKYAAYSMDGVTSASKLAAQRSHTVAGQDERKFAVFTGIVVIFIVVGFAQIVFNKRS